jgi:hypothetical protein
MTVGKVNGCHNRAPYKETVEVQDGWTSDQTRRMVTIPFPMTTDCQYTLSELGQKDEKCVGCKWRKG